MTSGFPPIFLDLWNQKTATELARGLLFGDDSGFPGQLKKIFRQAGISHLAAASGSNLSFVLSFLHPLATVWWRIFFLLCQLLLLAAYLQLSGLSPSLWRAFLMWLYSWSLLWWGRKSSYLERAGCAFFTTALFLPQYFTKAGFWLSFLAVSGLAFSRKLFSGEKTSGVFLHRVKRDENTKQRILASTVVFLFVSVWTVVAFRSIQPQGIFWTMAVEGLILPYQGVGLLWLTFQLLDWRPLVNLTENLLTILSVLFLFPLSWFSLIPESVVFFFSSGFLFLCLELVRRALGERTRLLRSRSRLWLECPPRFEKGPV